MDIHKLIHSIPNVTCHPNLSVLAFHFLCYVYPWVQLGHRNGKPKITPFLQKPRTLVLSSQGFVKSNDYNLDAICMPIRMVRLRKKKIVALRCEIISGNSQFQKSKEKSILFVVFYNRPLERELNQGRPSLNSAQKQWQFWLSIPRTPLKGAVGETHPCLPPPMLRQKVV